MFVVAREALVIYKTMVGSKSSCIAVVISQIGIEAGYGSEGLFANGHIDHVSPDYVDVNQ